MADTNLYESDRLRSEYLLFHYGAPAECLPWEKGPREALGFPARIANRFSPGEARRALDLGCAVGRSAFELSRSTEEVVGIDYSCAFVAAAEKMRVDGRVEVSVAEEGNLLQEMTLELPAGCRPSRVRFEQGDAMALRPDLGAFDRVLAANLLRRLADPGILLRRFAGLVRSGGELILTTPCTWLEEFTPRDRWPPATTAAWLEKSLTPEFSLSEKHDEPFLIREHARKFQWSVAMLTKWRRR